MPEKIRFVVLESDQMSIPMMSGKMHASVSTTLKKAKQFISELGDTVYQVHLNQYFRYYCKVDNKFYHMFIQE